MEKHKIDKLKDLVSQGIPMKRRDELDATPTPNLDAPITPEVTVEPTAATPEPAEAPKTIERSRRKSSPKGDYESQFLAAKEFKERRAIYISKEQHQDILYILRAIGDSELSTGAFVNNIIQHHFETYKDEIDALYEQKFQKPSQRLKKQ